MKVTDKDTGHVLESNNKLLCEIWSENPEKYVPWAKKEAAEKSSPDKKRLP